MSSRSLVACPSGLLLLCRFDPCLLTPSRDGRTSLSLTCVFARPSPAPSRILTSEAFLNICSLYRAVRRDGKATCSLADCPDFTQFGSPRRQAADQRENSSRAGSAAQTAEPCCVLRIETTNRRGLRDVNC